MLTEDRAFVSHDRERLSDSIIFFSARTELAARSKLFNLLFLLDFTHFRRTGRSVTGLEYRAERTGAVPPVLNDAWDNPPHAVRNAIATAKEIGPSHIAKDNRLPEYFGRYFSRRHVQIMEKLVREYKHRDRPSFEEVTRANNGAFEKAWKNGEGFDAHIKYEFALTPDDPHFEEIRAMAKEYGHLSQRTSPARGTIA
jgi:hypothetical protein